MKTSNRKNLLILSFTMLVVMLGYSLAMPLLPFYIEKFGVGAFGIGQILPMAMDDGQLDDNLAEVLDDRIEIPQLLPGEEARRDGRGKRHPKAKAAPGQRGQQRPRAARGQNERLQASAFAVVAKQFFVVPVQLIEQAELAILVAI